MFFLVMIQLSPFEKVPLAVGDTAEKSDQQLENTTLNNWIRIQHQNHNILKQL